MIFCDFATFLVYLVKAHLCLCTGAAWRETWCEKAYHDETTLELKIERTANKWACTENGARVGVGVGRVRLWALVM